MKPISSAPLGTLLVAARVITYQQRCTALELSQRTGVKLGEVLVAMGACTEEQLLRGLSAQTGLESIDLDRCVLDVTLTDRVPRALTHFLRAVPLWLMGTQYPTLVVAVPAPLSPADADRLRRAASVTALLQRLATDNAVRRGLTRLYGASRGLLSLSR